MSAIGLVAGAAIALLLAWPTAVWAQAAAGELAQQRLGRPYWHVFIAYALVWLLVAGWVISIARRLARVEKRLEGSER